MAKQKPYPLKLYTDGSFYPRTSTLGSAWIRANEGQDDVRHGYCIQSENNKSGSLLAEITAVSQGLRQLTEDLGSSKVTIYTDCQVIRDTAYNKEFGYRANKAKLKVMADAWLELGEEIRLHDDVHIIWAREENEPKLQKTHEMAQFCANLLSNDGDRGDQPYDVDVLDFNSPQ